MAYQILIRTDRLDYILLTALFLLAVSASDWPITNPKNQYHTISILGGSGLGYILRTGAGLEIIAWIYCWTCNLVGLTH